MTPTAGLSYPLPGPILRSGRGCQGVAKRSRSDGPVGTALDRSGRERMLGAGEGKSVGDASVFVIAMGAREEGAILVLSLSLVVGPSSGVGGVGRTGWQIEVGQPCLPWCADSAVVVRSHDDDGELSPRL